MSQKSPETDSSLPTTKTCTINFAFTVRHSDEAKLHEFHSNFQDWLVAQATDGLMLVATRSDFSTQKEYNDVQK